MVGEFSHGDSFGDFTGDGVFPWGFGGGWFGVHVVVVVGNERTAWAMVVQSDFRALSYFSLYSRVVHGFEKTIAFAIWDVVFPKFP